MKTHKYSVVFAIMMVLVLILSACGTGNTPQAQSTATEDQKPITLTFFDKNTGAAFSDPVAQEIMKRTGVKIEVQQPTGNPEEKLTLMLAGGDLPDIILMDRRSDIVGKYIAAKALIPLDDLIDKYGPNVKKMYGDVLAESRYLDGKNYYLNNWYGIDPDPDRGINMRMDILKELGFGEKAEKGDYFTLDEFEQILTQFKEKYPTVDGQASIPFTLNGEYMETVMSTFRGMYGMKNYYETDGKLLLPVRDPKYLEMVEFINRLYREGLLDREWAINKSDLLAQKLSSGAVFAVNGGLPSDINNLFQKDNGTDTDKQFYMFKVVAPGVDPNKTTFSPRSSLGWDAIGISATNKHPVETMKFIDFLASEEGQYLLMWGVEGKDWTLENGVHKPNPETIPGFRNDWGAYSEKTGIRKWTWFIKNGFGSDGTPYDLVTKYDLDPVSAHARISMVNSVWDTAPYDNVGPEGGTPDALIEQKLRDIMDQGFSKMVYAGSSKEVEQEYNKMMTELEANGASSIEAIYTQNYQKHLELWK